MIRTKTRWQRRADTHTPAQSSFLWRRRALMGGLAGAFVILTGAVFYRQIIDTEFLTIQGDLRCVRELEIPARRGMILDRNGEPLAVSTPMKTVWADPRLLSTHPEAMGPLAKALDLDAKKLAERVQANSAKGFMYLVRRVEPSRTIKVKDMIAEAKGLARQNVKDRAQKKTDVKIEPLGVEIDSEYRRYYPGGEVFGHILGFTNIDDPGRIPFVDHDIVQGQQGLVVPPLGLCGSGSGCGVGAREEPGTKQAAGLFGVGPIQDVIEAALDLVRRDVCQKPQAPEVDTHQGNVVGRQGAGGREQCAVAAYHHRQVALPPQGLVALGLPGRPPEERRAGGVAQDPATTLRQVLHQALQGRRDPLGLAALADDADGLELGHGGAGMPGAKAGGWADKVAWGSGCANKADRGAEVPDLVANNAGGRESRQSVAGGCRLKSPTPAPTLTVLASPPKFPSG